MPRNTAGVSARSREARENERFRIGLARAFAGALLFALPMLMTMEMWSIGFYVNGSRLALLTLASLPLLTGLSHYSGFERTTSWWQDFKDACTAYGIGWLTVVAILSVFGLLHTQTPLDSSLGKIAIQAMPASMGAVLARSQLMGSADDARERDTRDTTYGGELVLMAVGALFLAVIVAPTEEVVLIAYKLYTWQTLLLLLGSVLMMHAFVYAVEFGGSHSRPEGTPLWSAFARFTVAGYAIVMLISLYMLWTFGRVDDVALRPLLGQVVVLSFPAALGAASARLVL
jgi:putative integral membrane protein (TIGR02587 family)